MIGPLPYIGGKRRVAVRLSRFIPDHIAYVEPFAGGAQLFFHKHPSPVEVLNDLDDEIINFFRICQQHHPELIRVMQYWVASRRLFEELLALDPASLTDVQRAARWLYLQRNAFGGRIHRRSFRYAVTKPHTFRADQLPELVARAAARLARVQLERLPYEDILRRYDRPSTFFFLDPPYVGIEAYRFNFEEPDFVHLAERLRVLLGRFVLTINDCALTRRLFADFHVREPTSSIPGHPACRPDTNSS